MHEDVANIPSSGVGISGDIRTVFFRFRIIPEHKATWVGVLVAVRVVTPARLACRTVSSQVLRETAEHTQDGCKGGRKGLRWRQFRVASHPCRA